MKYILSKTNSQLLIASSIFIILNCFLIVLSPLFNNFWDLEGLANGINHALIALASIQICLVFFNYFRKYKLKFIAVLILIILLGEIARQAAGVINSYQIIAIAYIIIILHWLGMLATYLWIYLVLRLETRDYYSIDRIKKIALGILAAFLVGIVITLITSRIKYEDYRALMHLAICIPYFFIIEFGLKCKAT